MKQGYRGQGKCQETGAKESGNGIRNGGRRRLEKGEIEGRLIHGEWKDRQRTATGMGKEGENVEKNVMIKDKRSMRCYKAFLIG